MSKATSDMPTACQSNPRLKCLQCSAPLEITPEQVVCPACGKSWQVKNGIARFFQPDYYWGEVTQERALQFLEEAQQKGWREAVAHHFAGDENMLISLLDTQRASWLPMLGLGSDAVALDMGSGYGAITQSLAQTVGEVYSLEAIPERIEFTRIRMEQEGISNVHLVQGSALDSPFCDNFFDLIVLNGVLEWVGEWERNGNPRSVQVRFLSRLRRLLKDNGVLVIGIENRFGYGAFLGDPDHSGLPYTSLMPRFLASLYLRHSRRPHHRMKLNPRREYRTYTYSQRGYRKLLAESGYGSAHFYWADPGYNQPYALLPLQSSFPRQYFQSKVYDLWHPSRSRWRWWAKDLWVRVGSISPIVPEFLIVAEKGAASFQRWTDRLWEELSQTLPTRPSVVEPLFALFTHGFGTKTLVHVFDLDREESRLILKTSTPTPQGEQTVKSEFTNLALVSACLRTQANPPFSVPVVMGSFRVGSFYCTVESRALGQPISRRLFSQRGSRRIECIQRALLQGVDVAVQLAQILHGETRVDLVHHHWWDLPSALESQPDLQRLLQTAGTDSLLLRYGEQNWVQHGDFTVDNLFVDPSSGKATVIDWANLVRGVPPLYDVFSFLISALPALSEEKDPWPPPQNFLEPRFLTAFFGRGTWASFVRELLLAAGERLSIPPSEVWPMFVQFLVLRLREYLSRHSPWASHYEQLLQAAAAHDRGFVLAPSRS